MRRHIFLVGLAILALWHYGSASADTGHGTACDGLIIKKDWEQAVQVCSRAIQSGQLHQAALVQALTSRCWAYVKLRRFDDALADCSEAIRLDPKFVGAYSNRAVANKGKGQYGRAIEDYTKALRLNPDYVFAYNNRGVAYHELGQYDRAIDDYNEALRRDAGFAPAYFNRSNAYLAKSDYDRVIEDCDRALALDPDYAAAYTNRATAYRSKGEYDRAMRDYDDALRLDPSDATSHWLRGVVYFYRGDFAMAEADIAASMNGDPLAPDGAPYAALWLQVARARVGKEAGRDLQEQFERIGFGRWPGPIARYSLGLISEEELDAAARDFDDAETQQELMCEVDFFVGEHHLVVGSRADAMSRFQSAVANCLEGSTEGAGAKAELSRIGQ